MDSIKIDGKIEHEAKKINRHCLQARVESSYLLIACRHDALTRNLTNCLDLKREESWLAAVLIQTIVRRKFSYSEVKQKRFQRDQCKKIQSRVRGMQGRKLARETHWKKLAVAPNPYALKLLRLRCKELKTLGNWTEMFDPVIKSFWYLNKKESYLTIKSKASIKEKQFTLNDSNNEKIEMPYTCWDPPSEFHSQLTCYLVNNQCYARHHLKDQTSVLKLSSKVCGKKFSDRNHYNAHRLVDHSWYCNVCYSENSGLNFPRCFACYSDLSSSENESIINVETEIKKVLSSLKCETDKEIDQKSNGIDHASQSIENETGIYRSIPTNSLHDQFNSFREYSVSTLKAQVSPNIGNSGQLTNKGMSPLEQQQKLKVCKRFMAGSCKNTACPLAHPGLRDSAKKIQQKQGNREETVVIICLEYLDSGQCLKRRECTKYHPYKRPPTKQIIREIYPLRTGPRRQTYRSGTIIDGNVINGIFQGYGLMFWPSGESFSGMFKQGLRHGTGVWKGNNGKKFVGLWENGLRSGWGSYTVDNEYWYQGYWKDGKFDGIGLLESSNGDRYEGYFKNGTYDGIGRFYKNNGDTFIGRTKSAIAYGPGILKLADGELYRGNFVHNLRCGNGICVYPNGSKYIGNWKNGAHSGRGLFIFNGEKYSGKWENGKKHGFGVYQFKNGDLYEGNFSQDHAYGKGTYRFSDDRRHLYHGEWANDQKHGSGTYYWANGSTYHGQWKNNRMEGKGVLICSSGAKYNGEFSRNQKHGFGIFKWSNGNRYDGNFENNQICGEGTIKYINGDKYCGKWKKNQKDGTGIFYYKNGDIYIGQFCSGERHGKGKLIISPNTALEEIYDGQWYKNQRHGVGSCIYAKKHNMRILKYEGQWYHGRRHGQGVLYFTDGSVYEGNFVNDCQDGLGTFTDISGIRYEGTFKENEYHGEGILELDDGSTYVGEFQNNKREGNGTLTYTNGSKFTGSWNGNESVGEGIFVFSHETQKIRLKTFGY